MLNIQNYYNPEFKDEINVVLALGVAAKLLKEHGMPTVEKKLTIEWYGEEQGKFDCVAMKILADHLKFDLSNIEVICNRDLVQERYTLNYVLYEKKFNVPRGSIIHVGDVDNFEKLVFQTHLKQYEFTLDFCINQYQQRINQILANLPNPELVYYSPKYPICNVLYLDGTGFSQLNEKDRISRAMYLAVQYLQARKDNPPSASKPINILWSGDPLINYYVLTSLMLISHYFKKSNTMYFNLEYSFIQLEHRRIDKCVNKNMYYSQEFQLLRHQDEKKEAISILLASVFEIIGIDKFDFHDFMDVYKNVYIKSNYEDILKIKLKSNGVYYVDNTMEFGQRVDETGTSSIWIVDQNNARFSLSWKNQVKNIRLEVKKDGTFSLQNLDRTQGKKFYYSLIPKSSNYPRYFDELNYSKHNNSYKIENSIKLAREIYHSKISPIQIVTKTREEAFYLAHAIHTIRNEKDEFYKRYTIYYGGHFKSSSYWLDFKQSEEDYDSFNNFYYNFKYSMLNPIYPFGGVIPKIKPPVPNHIPDIKSLDHKQSGCYRALATAAHVLFRISQSFDNIEAMKLYNSQWIVYSSGGVNLLHNTIDPYSPEAKVICALHFLTSYDPILGGVIHPKNIKFEHYPLNKRDEINKGIIPISKPVNCNALYGYFSYNFSWYSAAYDFPSDQAVYNVKQLVQLEPYDIIVLPKNEIIIKELIPQPRINEYQNKISGWMDQITRLRKQCNYDDKNTPESIRLYTQTRLKKEHEEDKLFLKERGKSVCEQIKSLRPIGVLMTHPWLDSVECSYPISDAKNKIPNSDVFLALSCAAIILKYRTQDIKTLEVYLFVSNINGEHAAFLVCLSLLYLSKGSLAYTSNFDIPFIFVNYKIQNILFRNLPWLEGVEYGYKYKKFIQQADLILNGSLDVDYMLNQWERYIALVHYPEEQFFDKCKKSQNVLANNYQELSIKLSKEHGFPLETIQEGFSQLGLQVQDSAPLFKYTKIYREGSLKTIFSLSLFEHSLSSVGKFLENFAVNDFQENILLEAMKKGKYGFVIQALKKSIFSEKVLIEISQLLGIKYDKSTHRLGISGCQSLSWKQIFAPRSGDLNHLPIGFQESPQVKEIGKVIDALREGVEQSSNFSSIISKFIERLYKNDITLHDIDKNILLKWVNLKFTSSLNIGDKPNSHLKKMEEQCRKEHDNWLQKANSTKNENERNDFFGKADKFEGKADGIQAERRGEKPRDIYVDGFTILMIAAATNNDTFLHYFLLNGANPFIINTAGFTARDLVPETSSGYAILRKAERKYLIKHLPVEAKLTCSFLDLCIEGTLTHEDVDEFISAKGNLNCTNNKGQTPLMIMVLQDNLRMIQNLLAKGADPNFKSSTGNIAKNFTSYNSAAYELIVKYEFFYFVMAGNIKQVKSRILANPSIVNVQGHENYTALLFAIEENNLEMVSLLVSMGASMEMILEDGRGIFELCQSKEMTTFFNTLEENGKELAQQPSPHVGLSIFSPQHAQVDQPDSGVINNIDDEDCSDYLETFYDSK